jgi:small subunit ribosomal protein S5
MDTPTTTNAPAAAPAQKPRPANDRRRPGGGGARGAGPRGQGGPRRSGDRGGNRPNFERPRPEFEQKMLAVRRVTRVVAGGRRMSFAIALAIGDKKGSIGLGTGKAGDTALAINKAVRDAKKNLIKIKTTKTFSIPQLVSAKYGSAEIMIMPNRGKGLVAGSAVRDLLQLAGIKDTTSKVLTGSKNKLNIARATMLALSRIAEKKSSFPVAEQKAFIADAQA